jgi:hypothetical protein
MPSAYGRNSICIGMRRRRRRFVLSAPLNKIGDLAADVPAAVEESVIGL